MNPTPELRAKLRADAEHTLSKLHLCEDCMGTGEDLTEGAPDGTPCQRCGGTGRWDERAPLAQAVLTLLDSLEEADREIAQLKADLKESRDLYEADHG